MAKCYPCPNCGANLDFNERCTCQDKPPEKEKVVIETKVNIEEKTVEEKNQISKEGFLAFANAIARIRQGE